MSRNNNRINKDGDYHKLVDDQLHEYITKRQVNKRIVVNKKTYIYLGFHFDRVGKGSWTVSVGGGSG